MLLILATLAICNLGHAGWVVGQDSDVSGVLKLSKSSITGLVELSHCDKMYGECELLEVYDSLFFSQTINYLQLAGASTVYAIPFAAGVAIMSNPIGWVGTAFSAGAAAAEAVGGIAVAIGGTIIASTPDSLDLARLYDYTKIYQEDFINNEYKIIVLSEDTIQEILKDLI